MESILLYFWCVTNQGLADEEHPPEARGQIFFNTCSATKEDAVVAFLWDPPVNPLGGMGIVTWEYADMKGFHLQRIEVRSVDKHHTNNKWMAFEKGNVPIFSSLSSHSELDAIGRYVKWAYRGHGPFVVSSENKNKISFWSLYQEKEGARVLPVTIENVDEFTEGNIDPK